MPKNFGEKPWGLSIWSVFVDQGDCPLWLFWSGFFGVAFLEWLFWSGFSGEAFPKWAFRSDISGAKNKVYMGRDN